MPWELAATGGFLIGMWLGALVVVTCKNAERRRESRLAPPTAPDEICYYCATCRIRLSFSSTCPRCTKPVELISFGPAP